MHMKLSSIVINNSFRKENRSLTAEERDQLRDNIVRDGIVSPLVLWDDQDILLDGHHRYDIASDMGLESVPITKVKCASEADARLWICAHARGRRNFTASESSYNRAKLAKYRMLTDAIAGKAAASDAVADIATDQGVSHRTVERDIQRADAVDRLPNSARESYLAGDLPITQNNLMKLATLPKKDIAAVVKEVTENERSMTDVLSEYVKPDTKPAKPAKKATKNSESQKPTDEKKPASERMAEWNAKVETLLQSVKSVCDLVPEGPYADQRKAIFLGNIATVLGTVKMMKCTNVCPKCKGEGCSKCYQEGFVTRQIYESCQK